MAEWVETFPVGAQKGRPPKQTQTPAPAPAPTPSPKQKRPHRPTGGYGPTTSGGISPVGD